MAERRLKSLEDVRRYLAHLIRQIEGGKLDPTTGGRLAYISSILLRAIEGSDLERRLEAIEKAMEEKRAR